MMVMCALSETLDIFGVGLIKLSSTNIQDDFELIYQKGIGISLIQNIFEVVKEEIFEQDQGTSIIPLDDFSIFINFFLKASEEKVVMIYMYEKENSEIYSQLYLNSRKLKNAILSDSSNSEIIKTVDQLVSIPLADGIQGVYILGMSGIPYFSRTNRGEIDVDDSQLVGGLISALFTFAQHLIGKDSCGQLKEINFGNRVFYTITKSNVIFVFLISKMTSLLQRYIYIIADQFLAEFNIVLEKFNGNISPFKSFGKVVDQYFEFC